MNSLILVVKGIIIGIANIIPGVSGGTLAVILGIYERLTGAIGALVSDIKNRNKISKHLKFLGLVFLGAAIGMILFARLIGFLMQNYPQSTELFFIGLILGSFPLIAGYAGLRKLNLSKVAGFLLGALLMGFFIYISSKSSGGHTTPLGLVSYQKVTLDYGLKLFLCGAIAAAAMIIPGISGSMVLILLGEYYTIINFINAFINVLIGRPSAIPFLQSVLAITCMGVGILVGMVVAARFINWALRHYKGFTFCFILGLMLVSIGSIWPGFSFAMPALAYNTVALAGGLIIALLLGRREH